LFYGISVIRALYTMTDDRGKIPDTLLLAVLYAFLEHTIIYDSCI